MNHRHPWRSRSRLLAFVDVAAGIATTLGGAAVAAGVTGDIGAWETAVAAGAALAVDFVAVLANIGIVRDGEGVTTPVEDPLGADLLPLMPLRQLDDLTDAVVREDYDRARELLGQHSPH